MKNFPLTKSLPVLVAAGSALAVQSAAGVVLIGAGLGDGNGDFNYEGGATTNPGTLLVNENIPRDRALVGVGNNPGQGITIDGWTFSRVTYTGANNAFGLDGHFGFDAPSFEPVNTGSGQAFQNGNSGATIDLTATTINFATGAAGDIFDLSYLLGSDSAGGNSIVTLTLDSGLGSEQTITFGQEARTGASRAGANTVTETYTSTGAYTTVDLNLRLGNETGSTRVLVDDVRLDVTPIPEPSAALLGGLGLLGLLRRRR